MDVGRFLNMLVAMPSVLRGSYLHRLSVRSTIASALALAVFAASCPAIAQSHQRTTTEAPAPTPAATEAPAPTPTAPPSDPPVYTPMPPTPTYGAVPYGAPGDGGPTVGVHLGGSSSGLVLERADPSGSRRFAPICNAPCDIRVSSYGEYRITGRGLRPSHTFGLTTDSSIDANLGSSGAMWTGVGLTIGGSVLVLTGLMVMAVGSAVQTTTYDAYGGSTTTSDGGLTGVGTGFLVVGAVATGIGLYLWLSNGSSVDVNGARVASTKKSRPLIELTPRGFVF
jgi:hypothetical protein